MSDLKFVQLEFPKSFYDLYFARDEDEDTHPKNPAELKALCDALNVRLDTDFLYETYGEVECRSGDIYIFHAENDSDVFLYVDLYWSDSDQMSMITLGVRTLAKDEERVRDLMLKLYFKAEEPRSYKDDFIHKRLSRIYVDEKVLKKRTVHHFYP